MSLLNATGTPLSFALGGQLQNPTDFVRVYTSLFNTRLNSAVKRCTDSNWRPVSQFYYLDDEDMMRSLRPDDGLRRAVRLDENSQFLVVSIPENSLKKTIPYIEKWRRALELLSGKGCLYEFEGAWLFYIYFTAKTNTDVLAKLLRTWAAKQGLLHNGDGVTILDSTCLLPLPLQPGFSWLDQNGEKLIDVESLSIEEALTCFVAELSQSKVDKDSFLEGLASSKTSLASAYSSSIPQRVYERSKAESPALKPSIDQYSENTHTNCVELPEDCQSDGDHKSSQNSSSSVEPEPREFLPKNLAREPGPSIDVSSGDCLVVQLKVENEAAERILLPSIVQAPNPAQGCLDTPNPVSKVPATPSISQLRLLPSEPKLEPLPEPNFSTAKRSRAEKRLMRSPPPK